MNNVTVQNVLDVLAEKNKELAREFKTLEIDLEENLKRLKGKVKDTQKQSNVHNQSNKTINEPSELTKRFVSLLDTLTKEGLYSFRLILISKYKSMLPKIDQSKLKNLIEQKDQENGFKQLLEANPLLKIEHENKEIHKDFNKLKEQTKPDPKLAKIIANKIMYNVSTLTPEQKEITLNSVVKMFEDEKVRKDILDSVNNRPKESMEKLQMFYPKVYEQFMKLKTIEDFEHVGRVIEKIKKCDDLDYKDEKALIEDLENRQNRFDKDEKKYYFSKMELKKANSDIYKQFLNAENLPPHLQDRMKEKMTNLTLDSDMKRLLFADLDKRLQSVNEKQQGNAKTEELEKGVNKTIRKSRVSFLMNTATQKAQDHQPKEKNNAQNQQREK
ncbi:hypothetical protein [Enterococcus villorum]|uniref:Uncharacterized protein n=3 Tax=Enterococcus villorum TaxID=112904 RepID=A0A511J175_9ENTE|nr:hypothetical protein [Enterococcus villorum]EOH91513.1 hypothetical protein UAO_00846 [Enterococcus villorum ATCC 700913]EOW76891.1 hypothetical protein I591_02199 [Enterococcus villorum ATCC 700913]GEL91771.1 hypothetical protein EVI01_11080 [Enterococcus villorum]